MKSSFFRALGATLITLCLFSGTFTLMEADQRLTLEHVHSA